MLFSIIIPIYNSEATLERCLKSILNQTFKDFEVIMVNDGSVDQSESICKTFTRLDERFKYCKQINSGVSVARNTGIESAVGKYITFLDSDDIYYPEYLQSFKWLIEKYPQRYHYWCGFQYISNTLESNGKIVKHISNKDVVLTDRGNIMSLHEMVLDASPVNKLYNRDILNMYKIRMQENISLGEDLIFNYDYLNYCDNTEIVILNKANYGYFCFSEESLNHRYRSDLKEIYDKLLEVMYQYINSWNVSEEQKRIFFNIKFYMYDSILRNTFHKNNKMSFFNKVAFNNSIMKSEMFQDTFNKSTLTINPLYKKIYMLKRYEVILIVNKLLEMKRRGR